MDNEEGTGTVVEIGSTRRRKAPARRKAAGGRRPAKPAARDLTPLFPDEAWLVYGIEAKRMHESELGNVELDRYLLC